MKTFLLTGCTAGLGLALVKKLVADYPNGHFIVVCRNVQKGNHVLEEQARILKKNDGNLTGKKSLLRVHQNTTDYDCN